MGFPAAFECNVAREMAAFVESYDPSRDLIVSVVVSGRSISSVTLDGSESAWSLCDGSFWTKPARGRDCASSCWRTRPGSCEGQVLGRLL